MQIRLLACLAGGLLGVVVASPINASLGLNPSIALIGFASVGLGVGYAASILFDVFTSKPEDESVES
ncbi:MAG: hypothetical protein LAP38_15045 [Acidobacteriia bacterium]|nr:hypothetical protein [Terriglobia bacterium]